MIKQKEKHIFNLDRLLWKVNGGQKKNNNKITNLASGEFFTD
jgi:hypothetical protein